MVVEYCFDTGSERAGSVRFERASLDLNSLVQWHRGALHNTTLPHLVFMKAWTLVSRRGGVFAYVRRINIRCVRKVLGRSVKGET